MTRLGGAEEEGGVRRMSSGVKTSTEWTKRTKCD